MGKRAETSLSDPSWGSQRAKAGSRTWMDRWMAGVRTLGNINAWIILTLFYFLILSPFGIIYRLVADPLRRKRRTSSWDPLPSQYDRLEDATKQS